MSIADISKSQPFALTAHVSGTYNARTTADGGITSLSTNQPIVQMHEREITGLAVANAEVGADGYSQVSEVSVPIYLAYDDAKSAISAAAGMRAGKKGMGDVSFAFERPGTVKIAWIGARKKDFYQHTSTSTTGSLSLPDSLQQVFERMHEHAYSKSDGLFSVVHSVPSVHYTSVDVKEVECTRVKIPKEVRPIVSADPAPAAAANGSTVYPPGKFIVLLGFATMRCNNGGSNLINDGVTGTNLSAGGWAFWLKVVCEVVLYGIEIAAALGVPYPSDNTTAAWMVSSNLVNGSGAPLPPLDPGRIAALRSIGLRSLKRLSAGPKRSEKPKRKRV